MRIIIKNADFSVYGIADISGLMSTLRSKFGGITNSNQQVVEDFLRALGADGSNGIWAKLKHLYMPCLALTTDSHALYDIITGVDYPMNNAAYAAVIEEKRGVRPATLGNTTGIGSMSVASDGLTAANMSMFTAFCQSTTKAIGTSSGMISILGSVCTKWENTGVNATYIDNSDVKINVANTTLFSTPNWAVLSCRENSARTLYTKNGNDTAGTLESYLSSPDTAYMARGWCCTSIFGICNGLTSSEASAVSSAISTFLTAFGIENTASQPS